MQSTIYINGEYLITSQNFYLTDKYGPASTFVLEDTAEDVLGIDFKSSQLPIVKNFRSRVFWMEKNLSNITEPILYGKIRAVGSPFMLAELVLLSEISYNKSIDEVNKLIIKNKINLKKINYDNC